jgi:hypothetical protein
MKIHTLSFQTFSLTGLLREFTPPHNCVDHQRRVVYIFSPDSYALPASTALSHEFRLNAQWVCPGAPPIMLQYHLRPD